MNHKRKIILLAVAGALFYWLLDSVIAFIFFHQGRRFFDLLFFDIPPHEIYSRIVAVLLFISYGSYAQQQFTERREAERRAAMSDAKFRSYIFHAPDGVIVTDPEGRCVEVNDAACRMTGYPRSEMVGMNVKALWPSDGYEEGSNRFKRLAKTGRSSAESEFRRKDGSRFWMTVDAVRLPDGSLIGFCKDTTERRLMEERLAYLNAVLRGIRNVNQLITREMGREELIDGACNLLVESMGYRSLWIALTGKEGRVTMSASAGLGEFFDPLAHILEKERIPECGRRAMENRGVLQVRTPTVPCVDCPVSARHGIHQTLAARLEYNGRVYGFITASLPGQVTPEAEDIDLFGEVANDIAFALYKIGMESARKAAEEALRKSESRFRSVIERTADAVMVCDMEGFLILANPGVIQATGFREDELLNRPVRDILHGGIADLFEAPEIGRLSPNHPVTGEGEIICRDGTRFPVEVRLVRATVMDRDAVIALPRDISRRHAERERLRSSEEFYRRLIEASPSAVVVTDLDGGIRFVSPRMVELCGCASEKEILETALMSWVHPDDAAEARRSARENLSRLLAGDPPETREYRILKKGGSFFYGQLRAALIRDAEGKPKFIMSVIHDITRRKEAEAEIVGREATIRGILNAAPIGIGMVRDDRFRWFNPDLCRVTGYSPDELQDLDARRLYPTDADYESVRRKADALVHGQGILYTETRFARKDGVVIDVLLSLCLLDANHRPAGLICTVTDITEKKEAERLLRVEHDLLADLAATSGLREALERIVEAFTEIGGVDAAGVYLNDEDDGALTLFAHRGVSEAFAPALARFEPGTPEWRVISEGTPVYGFLGDLFPASAERVSLEKVRAVGVLPIRDDDRVIAALCVASYRHDDFSPLTTRTVETILHHVGGVIIRAGSEKALRESQKLLDSVFQAHPDTLMVIDRDYRVLHSNWRGIEAPEKNGPAPTCHLLLRNHHLPCEDCYADEVFRTGKIRQVEHENLETGRSSEIYIYPVFDDAGNVVMVTEFLRDITDRKRSEAALKKSEGTLSGLLNSASMGICFLKNRVIGWVNPEMERITGYTKAELEGINARALYDSEEEYLRVGREKHGEILKYGVGVIDCQWRRKDGALIDVLVTSAEIEQGNPEAGLVATVLDITDRKRMERALQESERRLATLLSNLPGMAYRCENTRDWAMKFVSEGSLPLTGYTALELTAPGGVHFGDLIHPEDRERIWEAVQRSLAEKSAFEVEYRIFTRDGRKEWLWEKGLGVFGEDGALMALEGFAINITSRVRAERELRDHLAFQSVLGELRGISPDAGETEILALFAASLQKHYEMAECWFSANHDAEIAGAASREAADSVIRWRDERTLPKRCVIREALRESTPRGFDDFCRTDTPCPCRENIAAHGFRSNLALPLVTERGTEGCVMLYSTRPNDFAESRVEGLSRLADELGNFLNESRRRREAQSTMRRLAIAIENAGDAIVITDTTGRIDYFNPAFETFAGRSAEQLIGQRIFKVGGRLHERKLLREVVRTIRRGEVWRGNMTYTNVLDKRFEEEVSVSPIFSRKDALIGYVAVKRDVTEKNRISSQLRQAQKMEAIGTLAGGVAHDFNNILFPIIGFAEMGMEEITPEDGLYEHFEEIFNAATRARELVQQILAFSRQSEQERYPLKIQPIIKEAMKLMRSTIPSTVEIIERIDMKCCPILADPTQIHQIVMNLCTNAYHAMRETGGTMEIHLRGIELEAEDMGTYVNMRPGRYAKLSVRDTGVGIDRVVMERMFDPYFTTKKKDEGTGLGLSVVHGIVTEYGGEIRAYSEPGKGTVFNVYFPCIESDDVLESARKDRRMPTGSERILVVDDEAPIVKTLEKALTMLGYTVDIFRRSSEAVERFASAPGAYDLIVSDYTMPDLTGLQLAERIRGIDADIPIIICTGFSDQIPKETVEALRVHGVIMKPVIMRELAETVRKALDQRIAAAPQENERES